MAARFLIEEDEEQMRRELKEAFRFYDKEGELAYPTNIDTTRGTPTATPLGMVIISDKVDIWVALRGFFRYSNTCPGARTTHH